MVSKVGTSMSSPSSPSSSSPSSSRPASRGHLLLESDPQYDHDRTFNYTAHRRIVECVRACTTTTPENKFDLGERNSALRILCNPECEGTNRRRQQQQPIMRIKITGISSTTTRFMVHEMNMHKMRVRTRIVLQECAHSQKRFSRYAPIFFEQRFIIHISIGYN